jgi:hypothetical protein
MSGTDTRHHFDIAITMITTPGNNSSLSQPPLRNFHALHKHPPVPVF